METVNNITNRNNREDVLLFLNMIQKVKSLPGISDKIYSRYRKGM